MTDRGEEIEEDLSSLPDPDESDYDDLLELDFDESENDNWNENENNGDGIDYGHDYGYGRGRLRGQALSYDEDDGSENSESVSYVMDGRMGPKHQSKINSTSTSTSTTDDDGTGPLSSSSSPPIIFSDYILGTLIVRVVAARDLKAVKQHNQKSGGNIVGSIRNAIFNKNDKKPRARMNTNSNSRGGTSSNNSCATSSPNHQQQQQSPYNKHRNNNNHNQNRHDGGRRRVRGMKNKSYGMNYNYGYSNPYATLTFANQVETTSTVYDTICPTFPRNEQAYFDVSLPITHLAHEHEIIKDEMKGKLAENDIPLPPPPQSPILNITTMHSDQDDDMNSCYDDYDSYDNGATKSSPIKKKKNMSSQCSSDETSENQSFFLGTASIDVTHLITGKVTYIDQWLTLHSSNQHYDQKDTNNQQQRNDINITGQVRIICEYDMTDLTPRPGDMVRFNGFVNPMDVYPIPATQIFRVDDVGVSSNGTNNSGGSVGGGTDQDDILILSYKSKPENWYCTFVAHRFMFISVERHITAIERYQDELVDIVSKVVVSPAAYVVKETVARLPEEGLLYLGFEASLAGLGLAGRWFKGGVGTVVDDVVFAANLDGKSSTNVGLEQNEGDLSVSSSQMYDDDDDDDVDNLEFEDGDFSLDLEEDIDDGIYADNEDDDNDETDVTKGKIRALPSMPCCPISGLPMKEPVVAADGHTYEKKAITRWFRTSSISPLTGNELPHKELVPNYLLISTFGAAESN